MLPITYKAEHVSLYLIMLHSMKAFLLEHLVIDPTDEVSNIIILGADTENHWLEFVLADIEEKFSQTSLKFWVFWAFGG